MLIKAFLLSLITFLGLGQALADQRFYTADFFIETKDQPVGQNAKPSNCREHIKKVLCLVNPSRSNEMGDMKRTCLPGSQQYAGHFEEIYDVFPKQLQQMFCSLDHIFIEKEFAGSAYAALVVNKKRQIVGAKIGVRESLLENPLGLAVWASWKEQLSFGGDPKNYTTNPDLPSVYSESNAPVAVNDFFYFVLAHEFGHLFDFTNKLNFSKLCSPGKPCPIAKDSWAALSWTSIKQPLPKFDFYNRSALCFYACEGKFIAKDMIAGFYKDLATTNFISSYAATNPADDFAESLAYYVVDKYLESTYIIDTKQGARYNMMEKLHSELFAEKYQYIEKFLAGKIRYP